MLNKINDLTQKLNNASNAYYNSDKQLMSDFEYDKLYDELLELEKESGIILSNSPTQKVGYEVIDKFTKVEHKTQMLSLDKTKNYDDLFSFLGNEQGLLSWKLDGLTVILNYENGELISAVTRGNGSIGEDITHNAKVFSNIPIKVNNKETFSVRGEAIIDFETFNEINNKLALSSEEQYKNPRNLCSGSVRQLNSKITYDRKVKFIAFGLLENTMNFENKSGNLTWLNSLGFQTVEYKLVNKNNFEENFEYFKNQVTKLNYATDGLVLTFDSISYSQKLGTTSKFPKDSLAFKWKDEVAQTELIDVEWNTSRVGTINPIAIFKPVNIEGTEVERASLHNLSYFENFELGIGDTISVYKANMIIPQLLENETRSNTLKPPTTCEACGSPTERQVTKGATVLICPNPTCGAKSFYSFTHYVSRNAMNIAGFSSATIEKFIELGYLDTILDIYTIETHKEDIIVLKGFGEKSFNKLIESIEVSKTTKLENFIYSLGILNVGLSTAKLIVKNLKLTNIEDFLSINETDLMAIDGIGDITCEYILKYISNKENANLVRSVSTYLTFTNTSPTINESTNILEGKSFVITGSLETFKNRKELQDRIEGLGGTVSSSIKNDTSYLINNDITSQSSKNKSAKEKNIPIITETDFIEMIKN